MAPFVLNAQCSTKVMLMTFRTIVRHFVYTSFDVQKRLVLGGWRRKRGDDDSYFPSSST